MCACVCVCVYVRVCVREPWIRECCEDEHYKNQNTSACSVTYCLPSWATSNKSEHQCLQWDLLPTVMGSL